MQHTYVITSKFIRWSLFTQPINWLVRSPVQLVNLVSWPSLSLDGNPARGRYLQYLFFIMMVRKFVRWSVPTVHVPVQLQYF